MPRSNTRVQVVVVGKEVKQNKFRNSTKTACSVRQCTLILKGDIILSPPNETN